MKILKGTVIKKPSDKTVKVEVTRVVKHPLYQKRTKKTKRFLVHDEFDSKVGEKVSFRDTKPISKRKRWVTVKNKK